MKKVNAANTWLIQLEQQLTQLSLIAKPVISQRLNSRYFDQQLFSQRASTFNDYLTEITNNLTALKTAVHRQYHEQVSFLAERIVTQISAIQRELATHSLRQQETTQVNQTTSETLYQQTMRHYDYQRRLKEMITLRESTLTQQTEPHQKKQLQQEILQINGRLKRCNDALLRLEQKIEYLENHPTHYL